MMLDLLKEHLKDAMKSKNVLKRDVIRFIVSQVKNKQIDSGSELSDDDIVKIIKKEIKQIHETLDALVKNWSSQELIDDEKTKIEILTVYLPEMFSEEKTKEIVQEMITRTDIDVSQKKWQLIWMIMKEYWSSVDWKLLQNIVNSL